MKLDIKNIYKKQKVRLTKDVIDAYKEQDQLDKESVFVHCK